MKPEDRAPRQHAPTKPAAGSRHVVVEPGEFPSAAGAPWTFSVDVHRNLFSLFTAIWGALRRAGSDVAPMTYGERWMLIEPSTGRTIDPKDLADGDQSTLEAAGIHPGTVLRVVALDRSPV